MGPGPPAQALINSELRYRKLFETARDGILILDGETGDIEDVNPYLVEKLGVSREDFLEKKVWELGFFRDILSSQASFAELQSKGYVRYEDKPLQTRDGRRFDVEFISNVYLVNDRKVIQCNIRDISERKQAEVALETSEKRFQALFESSRDAIMTLEPPDWNFTSGNPASVNMFGAKSQEEFVSYGPGTLSPERQPDGRTSAEKAKEAIEVALSRGSHFFEWMHRRIGGQEFPADVLLTRMEFGGRVMLQATVRDITERKRVEESHTRLVTALEQAAETVVITDSGGTILYVNPAFEKSSGYARAEAVGRNSRILKSGKQDADFYRQMWEVLRRGEVWHGRFINKRKDGTLYTEDATISPVRDVADRIVNYIALKIDVTRETLLEDQLRQAQKMEAVGRLAGGVAHDFNNLLTVINGTAELASMGLKVGDPLHTDLQEILQAGRRAAGLTRQLLAFSRKQILQPMVLSLNSVIGAMQKMLQRLLGEDVRLQFVPAEGLGSVKADTGQIEQVIMNLAVNARDAMPKGGMVSIATRNVELDDEYAKHHAYVVRGPYVMVSVTDTGVGMDAATQARMFEPFFTTKPVGKGTGLGLATTYGIVKQSRGSIEVYSELGHGTTFKIYLPRVAEGVDESHAARPTSIATGTETIVAVDDDTALRDLAKRVLRSAGYRVLTAGNGGEALLLLESHVGTVDLLLTDVVMPGMSGRDLATRLLQLQPQMKVLFMSGYTDDAIVQHGVLDEATHFIHKPYSPAELTRKVREVLDLKGDRRMKG